MAHQSVPKSKVSTQSSSMLALATDSDDPGIACTALPPVNQQIEPYDLSQIFLSVNKKNSKKKNFFLLDFLLNFLHQ